jgi:hypothetical protein
MSWFLIKWTPFYIHFFFLPNPCILSFLLYDLPVCISFCLPSFFPTLAGIIPLSLFRYRCSTPVSFFLHISVFTPFRYSILVRKQTFIKWLTMDLLQGPPYCNTIKCISCFIFSGAIILVAANVKLEASVCVFTICRNSRNEAKVMWCT